MGGSIETSDGRGIALTSFSSAWYRRTTPPALPEDLCSKEIGEVVISEVGAFLDGVWETTDIFWINKPSRVRAAENKLVQLALAKSIGFQLPKTVVTNNPEHVKHFAQQQRSVIVKPISVRRVGRDGDCSGIYTQLLSEQHLSYDGAFQISPVILQERIVRQAELRITVVGNKLFATRIKIDDIENNIPDLHLVDPQFVKYEKYEAPNELSTLCLRATKSLGLVYAAFDFIITPEGATVFLEINPSGQWGWIEHETGFPITNSLAELLAEGRLE
jgi:glutathione synthase/RimK-type ligase-like ATP-grasp enzyme